VGPRISCGARKLVRTPRVTKKKKKKSELFIVTSSVFNSYKPGQLC
jgi:hypothetical protein